MQEVERTVKMLHDRDPNGLRHWQYPEKTIHAQDQPTTLPP
jgi:hypothetical protein